MEGLSQTTTPAGDRGISAVLAVTVAFVTLVPFATVGLRYRTSLVVQAALILAAVALATVIGFLIRRRLPDLTKVPRALLLGLLLYAAVALEGTVVALLRGNELPLLAGQMLSMGILPLAGLTGLLLSSGRSLRILGIALGLTTVAAVVFHFIYWWWAFAAGHPVFRLYLPNSVAAVGFALLGLLCCLAATFGVRGRRRILAQTGSVLIFLYIVFSGTRSLWLATAAGLAVFVAASRGRFLRGSIRLVSVTALLIVVGLSVFWLLKWGDAPRENQWPLEMLATSLRYPPGGAEVALDSASPSGDLLFSWTRDGTTPFLFVTDPIHLHGPGTYRWSGQMQGFGSGSGWVALVTLLPNGRVCTWNVLRHRAGDGWQTVKRAFNVPPEVRLARIAVGLDENSSGRWSARRLRLENLGSPLPATAYRQLDALRSRITAGLATVLGTSRRPDESVEVRVRETRTLLRLFAEGDALEKIFGHGLGARYAINAYGRNDDGETIRIQDANYIHDFWAFLLYKTGLLGLGAVAVAFGIWIAWFYRAASSFPPGAPRAALAAGLAALVAYAIWSFACPEVLDFRIAPLWGLLIGASSLRG